MPFYAGYIVSQSCIKATQRSALQRTMTPRAALRASPTYRRRSGIQALSQAAGILTSLTRLGAYKTNRTATPAAVRTAQIPRLHTRAPSLPSVA